MYLGQIKIVRNMLNPSIMPSDDIHEEVEIVSGDAMLCAGQNMLLGELSITNKRLVFNIDSKEHISFGLNEIKVVEFKKRLFSFRDKLTVIGKKEKFQFRLKYCEDWVSLFETLLASSSSGDE